ncbi:zinc knuckle domain-containing protein [Zymoseptoria brevis]|uniref:Zinc knuckle domain-containing protein n=1 Tax=Zymoseptoria brevis TaxID=1047168 RepID=A0A0F4GKR3_9PEZI|nr:zinc knuckle domain-containing protein [Zymoseptoria brevis]
MSSSIFFKFKSRKDALQINFDGTSLSVFEVKREIMNIARLGDGKDSDLDIYTSDTNEIYDDDTTQIQRSTTVIARRLPASRPGAGRAARYVTGSMPVRAKNSHRIEATGKSAASNGAATNGGFVEGKAMTEQERLQAVMNASNTQLNADLEQSANKPVMHRAQHKSAVVPDKPPPPGYECHRCGNKGHWIQACPTNNDPTFDNKPRAKKTTGIPRSMLEYVPDDEAEAIKNGEIEQDAGIWKDDAGRYVRVKTDEKTWQKIQDERTKNAEQVKEVAKGDQELRDRGLECDIDKCPFSDPVKTPCCGKTYCRDCIENTLLDADLVCPNCGEQALLDKLEPDSETVTKLIAFQDEKKADKQRKDKEASKSPAAQTPTADNAGTPSAPPTVSKAGDSPGSTTSNSRKRNADEELENDRRPTAPAAMRKTNSNQGKSAAPQPPTAPKSMMANQNPAMNFQNTLDAITPGAFAGMNGMNGMNGMANPMMMQQMMGMGMGMGMGMPNMGMPFGMMNGIGGFPNMNGMNGGMGGMNGGGGNMGWNNPQQFQQQWPNNGHNNNMNNGSGMRNGGAFNNNNSMNGIPTGPASHGDGAYMRQPVNPGRHNGKQRRQRSVDYKQM